MKIFVAFFLLLFSVVVWAKSNLNIDEVRVYKSKHKMDILFQGHIIKSYQVMLGRGGLAPKRKEGDNLVPEGKYILDYKNSESLFYKSIHISYPNYEDQRRADEQGVEPGGDIMVHGFPNHPKPFFKFLEKIGLIKLINWTAGCTAVENSEMDEIFENIEVPVPITIFH
jgi:murein L,D-transpeptidase YafK